MKVQPGIEIIGALGGAGHSGVVVPHLTSDHDYRLHSRTNDGIFSPIIGHDGGILWASGFISDYTELFSFGVFEGGCFSTLPGITEEEIEELAADHTKSTIGPRTIEALHDYLGRMANYGYKIVVTPLNLPFEHELIQECDLRSAYEGVRIIFMWWQGAIWRIFIMPPDSFDFMRFYTSRIPVNIVKTAWWCMEIEKIGTPREQYLRNGVVALGDWIDYAEAKAKYEALLEHSLTISAVRKFPLSGHNIYALDTMSDYEEFIKMATAMNYAAGEGQFMDKPGRDGDRMMKHAGMGGAELACLSFREFVASRKSPSRPVFYKDALSMLNTAKERHTEGAARINTGIMKDLMSDSQTEDN